jgi:excisionase family DNA binding protein
LRPRTRSRFEDMSGLSCAGARLRVDVLDHSPTTSDSPDGCLLDAGDVALMLGVPKSWVYAETRAGRLPHVVLGRYRRYRRDAVEAWIAEHERGPVGGGLRHLGRANTRSSSSYRRAS